MSTATTASIDANKEEQQYQNPDEILEDLMGDGPTARPDTGTAAGYDEVDPLPDYNKMEGMEGKVLADPKYVIPASGVEVIPLATLASFDLNGNGAEGGIFEMTAENSIGSVLVVCAYQSILTALKSEQARKEGAITRQQQVKLIATTAMESGRSSAFTLVVCSALITIFPWLTPFFAILGVVGGAGMGYRVVNEFWAALDEQQRNELKTAAENAKVNLSKVLPTDPSVSPVPAGAAA